MDEFIPWDEWVSLIELYYYLENKILNNSIWFCYICPTEITDGRKLSPSAQAAVRHKAVHAVINGKMTLTKAAEIFGITRTSVCL